MLKRIVFLFIGLLVLSSACNRNTSSIKSESENRIVDELELLTQQLQSDSTNAGLWNQRAQLFLGRAQFDRALYDVNKALENNPADPDIFLTLADIYISMGKPDNCNAALLKAADLAPNDPRPYVKLAELNLLLENLNMALGWTDKSLEASKFNPDAYYVRGMIFLARKDTLSALKNIKLGLDQNENFYEAMIQLGIIYTDQANPIAEQYLMRALKVYPESMQARYQLALYLQDNERVDEALKHYDTLLMRHPENKFVLFNIGYAHMVYLNEFNTAISYFDEALLSDPTYIDALYNKGRALEELGRYVNARDVYNEVLRRKTNYELAIEGLNRLDRRR